MAGEREGIGMMDLVEKYKQLEASLLLTIKDLPVETKLKIAKQIINECGQETQQLFETPKPIDIPKIYSNDNDWNYDMSAMPIIVLIGLVIGIFIIGTGVLTYVLRNEGGQMEGS